MLCLPDKKPLVYASKSITVVFGLHFFRGFQSPETENSAQGFLLSRFTTKVLTVSIGPQSIIKVSLEPPWPGARLPLSCLCYMQETAATASFTDVQ